MILMMTGVITMAKLRPPTHNPTPCDVRHIDSRDGVTRLALAMDTVSGAVRWFTLAELTTVNTRLTIAECISLMELNQSYKWMIESTNDDYFDSRSLYLAQLRQQIRAALEGNTPDDQPPVIGCNIKVVPMISLWHESMASNAA